MVGGVGRTGGSHLYTASQRVKYVHSFLSMCHCLPILTRQILRDSQVAAHGGLVARWRASILQREREREEAEGWKVENGGFREGRVQARKHCWWVHAGEYKGLALALTRTPAPTLTLSLCLPHIPTPTLPLPPSCPSPGACA